MLSFLNLPMKVIGLVESNTSNREIAAGVVLALFLGLTPLNGPMALLLAVFFFVFKINRITTLLLLPLVKVLYLLGGRALADAVGHYLLVDAAWLASFWRWFTALPVIALLDINYTLIIGGLAVAAIGTLPVYFGAKAVSAFIRAKYAARVQADSRLQKIISHLKIAQKVDAVIGTDPQALLKSADVKAAVTGLVKERLFKRRPRPVKTPGALARRVNIRGLAIALIALALFHFGVGYIVSPFFTTTIVQVVNRTAGVKIAVERVHLWPLTLSFSLDGVKVFEPDAAATRIAKLDHLSVRIGILGLLSKRLVLAHVGVAGGEIDVIGRPDGTFNLQHMAATSSAASSGLPAVRPEPIIDGAMKNRDWLGKGYEIVKRRFSKEAIDKRAAKRAAATKAAATVEPLRLGKRIDFRPAADRYLFEINTMVVTDALIRLTMTGDAIAIDRAHIEIARLRIDPGNGMALDRCRVAGGLIKNDATVGRIDLRYDRTIGRGTERVRYDIDLKDVDLPATRFLYGDTLPVRAEAGVVDLSSRTGIDGAALDSRTEIAVKGHRFVPKDPSQTVFGVVPVAVFCEALNQTAPLRIDFTIGGTVEKPALQGLEDSLMRLVEPYLKRAGDRAIAQGAAIAQKALAKNLNKLLGKESAAADGSTEKINVDDAVKSLKSIFSSKSSEQ